jgi:hypothetical protein
MGGGTYKCAESRLRLAATPPAVLCSMPLFREYFITIDGIVKCSHEIFVPPLRGGMVKSVNDAIY